MIDYQTEKEITALLEKEIKDPSEEKKIKSLIEENDELKYEFILQSFIKTIAEEKLKFFNVPDNLKAKILRKINSGTIKSPYINNSTQRLIIYGSIILILLGIILVIINLFF